MGELQGERCTASSSGRFTNYDDARSTIQGSIVFFSDSGPVKKQFAVVNVEGITAMVVVPTSKLHRVAK